MELHIKDLENKNHKNDGSFGVFFYKGEKFTGKVYDTFDERISWIFNVKDGVQSGVEESYYEGTDVLEQVAEYENNMQFGVSKEFSEDGDLQTISVVWNNAYLKTIFLENSKIIKKENSFDLNKITYPEKILVLLNLSNKDLINYKFNE